MSEEGILALVWFLKKKKKEEEELNHSRAAEERGEDTGSMRK